jgi:hypothetical protein
MVYFYCWEGAMSAQQTQSIPRIQQIISVAWPSFVMAGIATILVTTAFDPVQVAQCMNYEGVTRIGAYSTTFFSFWLLTSSSCALTCFFRKPCSEIK